MSQLAYYMGRECLGASWTTAVILASFFAFCIPAQGADQNHKTGLAEREAFIRKAMDEEWERIKLSRYARAALLRVSTLVPFGDWDFYFIKGGSISWRPNAGQNLRAVDVPEGFVSDLTSIPRIFWQVLRPEGRYAYAAVVHDYLYWTQTRTREEADQIFRIALEDSKVEPVTIETVYQAVRRLGQSAWDNNAHLKKSGERRFLKRFPQDFTISWSDWKHQPDVFKLNENP